MKLENWRKEIMQITNIRLTNRMETIDTVAQNVSET